MQTHEIEHERWAQFLGEFSKLHHGERVNVETMGSGAFGVKSQLCNLPLVGIVGVDPASTSGEWIEIIAGDSSANHATHLIPQPSRVVVAEERRGQGAVLQIDSADGLITMVRSEPPREGIPAGYKIA